MEDKKHNYKIENKTVRHFTENHRKFPKMPLTESEAKDFEQRFLSEFSNDYKRFVIRYNLLNDTEWANLNNRTLKEDDLTQDGYRLFKECLMFFDKEPFIKKISSTNTQGEKESKTLEWFFMTYCRKRIVWHCKDSVEKSIRLNGKLDSRSNESIMMDSEDFESNLKENEEEELLKMLLSSNSKSLIIQKLNISKEDCLMLLRFIIQRHFGFFTDSELIYEYSEPVFKRLESLQSKLLKNQF